MSKNLNSAPRRRRTLDWILDGCVALLFLCSLFVFVGAPTSWFWILAILSAECGHYAGIAALLFAFVSWRRGPRGRAIAALAVVTAALYFLPAIRAAAINRSLPRRITAVFGALQSVNGRPEPFVWLDLFRGLGPSSVGVTEHVYASREGNPLKLDLYQSKDAGAPEPIVIILHGGSWNRGTRAQWPALPRYLAQEHYAVASIDYGLAPASPFPGAVEDVFHAIAFLKANAAALRLDPSRIILIGRSAGGQIALSAAYAEENRPSAVWSPFTRPPIWCSGMKNRAGVGCSIRGKCWKII